MITNNNQKKIKIAHIITRMDWGGAPDIVRIICRGLDPQRYEVTLIMGQSRHITPKTAAFLSEFSGRVITVSCLRRDINPFFDFAAFLCLMAIFIRKRFAIVHTHTAKAGVLGRLAASLCGIKTVHMSHGHNFYGYFGPLSSRMIVIIERVFAKFTDMIVALTRQERADLLHYAVAPDRKIAVVHTAVEVNQDKRERSRLLQDLGLAAAGNIVGMVGRLEQIKGSGYFIQAAAQIAAVFPDVTFLVIGEGSMRPELEKIVQRENLRQRVIFLGWYDDAEALMPLLDVLVLASLNEAVGLVLLEAQANGVPVVATKVGGIPEVVLEGATGILVEPKSAPALAQGITTLLKDESKRKAMGAAGQCFVQDKYSAQDMVRKLSGIYEQVLGNAV